LAQNLGKKDEEGTAEKISRAKGQGLKKNQAKPVKGGLSGVEKMVRGFINLRSKEQGGATEKQGGGETNCRNNEPFKVTYLDLVGDDRNQ